MKQHLPALLCLVICMVLAAASAGALIVLPKDLTAIGESAFSGIGESVALIIPDGVAEIPAGAFAGTKIHSLVLPAKMLPAGAIGEDAFDWDSLQFVTAYKGSEEEREAFGEENVYDFFLAKQEEYPDLVLFRNDPYIRSVFLAKPVYPGDKVFLFPESQIMLGVEAPNLFVREPKWKWQQSADGMEWTDCVLNEEDPGFYEGTVTAEPGMPRFYRATAVDQNGIPFISENILEVVYVSNPVLTFTKTRQEGTSAFFSWSCSWETGGTGTADNEPGVVFTLCRAKKNEAGDYVPGENDEIIETPLSGHECRVDLLRPGEEYAFYLRADSGGVQEDGGALPRTETGSTSCVSEPVVVKLEGEPPAGPVFRALLIGEVDFGDDYCGRNYGDVLLMRKMLRSVKGAAETSDGIAEGEYGIAVRRDLTGDQILRAVRETFKGADSDDVSLFFIATHGDVDHEGDEAGYLFTTEPKGEDGKGDTLPLQKLAKALAAVRGRVIVILQSCGSGAAVYSEEETAAAAASLNAAAVRAFSEAEAEEDGLSARTGEFRIADKFYVLTASRYQEVSWGIEGPDPHNYFTKDLVNGVLGTKKDSAGADADDDGVITLQELHGYIQSVGDGWLQDEFLHFETHELIREYQKTQVYPEDGDIALFRRN